MQTANHICSDCCSEMEAILSRVGRYRVLYVGCDAESLTGLRQNLVDQDVQVIGCSERSGAVLFLKSEIQYDLLLFNRTRLCRLPCGKATPYRARYFYFEAMPPFVRRHSLLSDQELDGKAQPFRTEGGRAAVSLALTLEISDLKVAQRWATRAASWNIEPVSSEQ